MINLALIALNFYFSDSAYAPHHLNTLTLCLMFNEIVMNQSLPKRLSTDNEPLFKNMKWQTNLRVLEIEEIKTVPYTPISHTFVER